MKKLFAMIFVVLCWICFIQPISNQSNIVNYQKELQNKAVSDNRIDKLIIAQEDWEFEIPNENWVQIKQHNSDIKVSLINEDGTLLIVFIKEELLDDNLNNYVINLLHSFTINGFRFQSFKYVLFNDKNFVLLETDNDDKIIQSWVLVQDGYCYVLTCGGFKYNLKQNICENIFRSLVIR